jgi:hypothetical protein
LAIARISPEPMDGNNASDTAKHICLNIDETSLCMKIPGQRMGLIARIERP